MLRETYFIVPQIPTFTVFTDAQIEVIEAWMLELCQGGNLKQVDYSLRVLQPEITIRIYMVKNNCSFEQAERVSFSFFAQSLLNQFMPKSIYFRLVFRRPPPTHHLRRPPPPPTTSAKHPHFYQSPPSSTSIFQYWQILDNIDRYRIIMTDIGQYQQYQILSAIDRYYLIFIG